MRRLLLFVLILLNFSSCERSSGPETVDPLSLLPLAPDNLMPTVPDLNLGVELVTTASVDISNLEFHPTKPLIYLIGLDGTIESFNKETNEIVTLTQLGQIYTVQLLMDFILHPDFLNNGKVYMAFAAREEDKLRSRVSQFNIVGDPEDFSSIDLSSEVEILDWDQVTTDSHNVNNLQFGPQDGYLYVIGGDGGCCSDSLGNSQSLKTFRGKTLRIDIDNPSNGNNYGIPSDNPFAGKDSLNQAIFAYGLRNPYRMVFDDESNLFIFDVGDGRREEVNLIKADDKSGPNFGWFVFEGNHCKNDNPDCDETKPRVTFPVFELKHPFIEGIIGGALYRGAEIPQLSGHMIFADVVLGDIWSLSYDVNSGTINAFWDILETTTTDNTLVGMPLIVSVNEDLEGNIYFVYLSGEVYRLKAL